jgi:hypothetical protein
MKSREFGLMFWFGLLLLALFSSIFSGCDAQASASTQAWACPSFEATPVDVTKAGIFKNRPHIRKPKEPDQPDSPNVPSTPIEPPKFEFPITEPVKPELPIDTAPGDLTDAEKQGFKDWDKDQWKAFFDMVLYFISAISGMFGGAVKQRGLLTSRPT